MSKPQHLIILLLYKEVVREDRQEGWVDTERLSKEEKKTATGRGNRGEEGEIRIKTRTLNNFAASVCFPQKIRNERRSSAKWFLLFCLSQFVVHLFTFLLVPHRRPVVGQVLRGGLLGASQCGALLIFGFLHWLALAWCCGSRLFGFRARAAIPVNLRMSDSGNEIPELSYG